MPLNKDAPIRASTPMGSKCKFCLYITDNCSNKRKRIEYDNGYRIITKCDGFVNYKK